MKNQALLILLAASSTLAQGTFQNLDFESATLISAGFPGSEVMQFGPAFPGWTGLIGTNPTSVAYYNVGALDASRISIIDSGWSTAVGSVGISGPIDGQFSALLFAGVAGIAGTPQDTFLSQTGLIPTTAKSLMFKASGQWITLDVTLGGQSLSYVALQTTPNYTLYAANIEQWAGQTAELEFTLFTQRPHNYALYAFLDSIEFSPVAIPEPGFLTLSALGILLLTWRFPRSFCFGYDKT